MTHVLHVVGARPNFVKMAPVIDALGAHAGVRQTVVHTGQHYDDRMSSNVMDDLGFRAPDVWLGIGSGTHGAQTGRALMEVEEVLEERRPDLVCVAGDVNSTLAVALAASKLQIPVAHVEAGLRSFDWTMPEEINRVLVDRLSDLLFTHSPEATANLEQEGIDPARVHFVGNTMIDSLRRFEDGARARRPWAHVGVTPGRYALVTLHRPSNVDTDLQLGRIVVALEQLAARMEVVFPMHPRTRARLADAGLLPVLEAAAVRCIAPVGYLDFLGLEAGAGAIVTDSGGVQEEATALGVPCYTLRANTERPVTVVYGTNTLLGDDPAAIADVRLRVNGRRPRTLEGWDGHAGERVAAVLASGVGRGRFARPAVGPAQTRELVHLFGCDIDCTDMEHVVARCRQAIETRSPLQHVSVNAAKVVAMQQDGRLREIANGCGLVTADGQSVVWASHLLRSPLPCRVTGIDLMHELLALAEREGYRVYVLGARAEVLDRALARLRERHPGITVAGSHHGYFTADEEPAVVEAIRAAQPDLLFVAMPSPAKEYFLARRREELGVPFAMGVGGAIDVLAGITRRAPVPLQRMGLEWAYRLAQEPRRLFGRYLVTNCRFVMLTARQATRRPAASTELV